MHPHFCEGGLVDVGDSLRLAVVADDDLPRHGVGNKGEAPSGLSRWDHHLAGAEVRGADASSSALRAIVARRGSIDRLCQHGHARGYAGYVELVAGLLDQGLGATGLWWRKKNS